MIAAKAVAFKLAAEPEFAERQRRTLRGAQIIGERLLDPEVAAAGVSVVTGGTDVHLVLVDLRDSDLDGQQGEDRLHRVGITMNRNAVPFDPRPPMVSSGLRIGTPPLATRISDKVRYPVLGATFQPRGGIAKHDHVAWAFAKLAGFDLPIQSHQLQALVSELHQPVHPTVVMSNHVHVYVSPAHKELVMGAGIETYNGYGHAASKSSSIKWRRQWSCSRSSREPICCAPGAASST